MDYKRLVSYIYAYNEGEKDKNVGFAKVETRNGQCNILINLKGIYTDSPESYGVYLFTRKDNRIILIRLGNIIVKNGIGTYQDIMYENNINSSGYPLNVISGLVIGVENNRRNILASQWDDEDIDIDKIVFRKEKQEQKELAEEAESEDEKSESTDIEAAELRFPEPDIEEPEAVEVEVTEPEAVEVAEPEAVEVTESEVTESEPIDEQSPWEAMFNNADYIDAFDDDYCYDCIEVTPEILRELPVSDASIVNNSFLMHGYYNYKHVLFGRVCDNSNNTKYFIGVPGGYCNRERVMASMFGFNNFKKSHRSDCRRQCFGYWYQEI